MDLIERSDKLSFDHGKTMTGEWVNNIKDASQMENCDYFWKEKKKKEEGRVVWSVRFRGVLTRDIT